MADYESARSRAASQDEPAAAHSAMPGKRTLTEQLGSAGTSAPVQRSASSSAGPTAPASTTTRTPLDQLFAGFVQRHAADLDEGPPDDTAAVHASAARGIATPTSSLPHAGTIQGLFGHHDISGIQAHTGTEAAASAQEMGADAYATGNHVVLGGKADLHTVAHEAAHVVQQRGGVQLKGVGAAGDRYEQHADAVADRVVQGKSAEPLLDEVAGDKGAGAPGAGTGIQMKPADWNGAAITNILALPHGWFSTSWKPLKAKIREYKLLLPVNVLGRQAKLREITQLIAAWKQDPKHAPNSQEVRVQNIRAQLPTLEEHVREEFAEIDAEATEAAVGGHSLTRHGPDMTDVQLQNRITTGLDRAGHAAATDTSSRFESYQTWLLTRTAAVNLLDQAVAATRAHLNPHLTLLTNKWRDFLIWPAGPMKGVAGQQRAAAVQALNGAAAGIANPSPNMVRVNVVLPAMMAVTRANVAAMMQNVIVLRPRYAVTINHGHPVGPSFVGTGPAGGPHPGTAPGAMQTSSTTVLDPAGPPTLQAAPAAAGWPMVTHFPSAGAAGIS